MRFASQPGDSSGACPTRNAPTGVSGFLQRDLAQQVASPSPPPRAASPGSVFSPPRSTTRPFLNITPGSRAASAPFIMASTAVLAPLSETLVAGNWSDNSDVESQLSPGVLLRVIPVR